MWSDRETEQDCLGYTSYVNVLAGVCTDEDLSPLTLGIFGSWGSGKTSLMLMLKRRVEEIGGERTVTLWFNAWRYEGREEAQSALVHAILAKLKNHVPNTKWDQVKDVAKRLKTGASVLKLGKVIAKSAMTLTPDIEGFLDLFQAESEQMADTMESFDASFEELLRGLDVERIVVFIDDLDRCSSAKVIETFETIKLFLNTPASTFVIGADAAKIEAAVGEVYSVADSMRRRDFLEKIIQIPFSIPEQDLKDIACYVGILVIGRFLDAGGFQTLANDRARFYESADITKGFLAWPEGHRALFTGKPDEVVNELLYILPYVDSLGRGLRGNPRQIKRFLNILAVRRRLAEENELDVTPGLLIKLGVLEYVWPDFFNAIAETVDPTTGQSELVGQMVSPPKDGEVKESKLLTESLSRAGLVEYLMAAPVLTGTVDLRPYLVLAQTSLSRGRAPVLVPTEEKARALASTIEGDDDLRQKAAARQAAAAEPAMAAAVVRALLGDLITTKDAAVRVRIISGVDTIALAHKDQYDPVIRTLGDVDPSNSAVAVAAMALLTNAESMGIAVPGDLRDRFAKSSPIAAAFGQSGTKRSRAGR